MPPLFDGNISYFSYEKAVFEWCAITTVEEDKRGVLLKHSMSGHALMWREFMEDSDLMKKGCFDNLRPGVTEGVKILLSSVKTHMIKDAKSVYLFRLTQFHRLKRAHMDFYDWMLKFQLAVKRLKDAWMDLVDLISFDVFEQVDNIWKQEQRGYVGKQPKMKSMHSFVRMKLRLTLQSMDAIVCSHGGECVGSYLIGVSNADVRRRLGR